jgi:hypothetical protein
VCEDHVVCETSQFGNHGEEPCLIALAQEAQLILASESSRAFHRVDHWPEFPIYRYCLSTLNV